MKITIDRNWIDVLGMIWWPACTAALRIELTNYDLRNIGEPTRENVEDWLGSHSGDFQSVTDFHAVVGEVEIPWANEENEMVYLDCVGEPA